MGGADSYCSVSGARYFFSTNEFFDNLSSLDEALVYNPEPNAKPLRSDEELQTMRESFSAGLRKYAQALRYSEEDVESSSTFVLLCPCQILEDGTMIKYTEFDDPHPTEYTESTITAIPNIFPGDNPDLGDYQDINGRESYTVLPCGNNLIITFPSYLILKQAAPDVKPHILYALAYGGNRETMGEVEGIDYGPVGRIFEQYAFWAGICETGGLKHPVRFWRELLCDKERAYEDVVYDAWKGRGNMWVFVRPDRFPIPETLSSPPLPQFPHRYPITTQPTLSLQNSSPRPTLPSLPPDILLSTCQFLPIKTLYALITTCKTLRSIILPHANPIARRRLMEDEPWYLPAGPFDFNNNTKMPSKSNTRMPESDRREMHGGQEVEWWAAQWGAGGISQEEEGADNRIPWFVYRKECSKSMSMWNRKRIWGICEQLDGLARKKGLL